MDILEKFQNRYFILVIFELEALWISWQYFNEHTMGILAIFQNRFILSILAMFQIEGIRIVWQYFKIEALYAVW